MIARIALPAVLLIFYLFTFLQAEKNFAAQSQQLSHPLPPAMQEIGLGYLRQLGGQIQFIKAAVFLGGLKTQGEPLDYAAPLAAHLGAAVHLHPHFIDTYYLGQATLPFLNDEYAEYANRIHARGMTVLPDNFVLPFFIGFNYFYHLKDPAQAAGYLKQAGQLPGAPAWFGHLAGTLAAEGGDIYGGLLWLRAMLATEEDEEMRARYAASIAQFEKAVTVQQAIQRYREQNGRYPEELTDLVPAYLPGLPELNPPFTLSWIPPDLRVVR